MKFLSVFLAKKIMNKFYHFLLFFVMLIIFPSLNINANALVEISEPNIPEELQKWIPWVLKDDPTLLCPILYNENKHLCAYPGVLLIEMGRKSGRFEQEWDIYAQSRVPLPGDIRFWPEKVKVNQQWQPVISHNAKPFILLNKGHYRIEGQFTWPHRPKSLSIPKETGLIDLTLENKKVHLPDFRDGKLWLKVLKTGKHQNNRLEVQVFRKITDSIPLSIDTQIKLSVSGDQREIILNGALLKDFIPGSIQSRLPALLDKQGRLKAQVRPGQWNIHVKAFYQHEITSISLPSFNKPWPANEVWVLDQQPQLRRINVLDKVSIDANQTQLPQNWKKYPAFQMQSNEQLEFNVIKRGDPEPEPDQLNLQKKIWLDFDGNGYTINDKITGKLSRQWRLNSTEDVTLGQVTLNGKPQYITQDNNRQGVEVRHGNLDLSADSRINTAIRAFSSGGWLVDFQSINATLYLPAGWKLFSLDGANSRGSWINQWTLLDFFIVLITAIAIFKLWGLIWGGIGLIALILSWHQPWSPQFIWINLIIAVALYRALPEGRLFMLVKSYRFITSLFLVLIALPFVVNQARIALYPQLEFNNTQINNFSAPTGYLQAPLTEPAKEMAGDVLEDGQLLVTNSIRQVQSKKNRVPYAKAKLKKMNSIDPDAMIQTGPGLPSWSLHQYPIRWDGPVRRDQRVSMILISPMVNSLLNVLRIVLTLLLVWRLMDLPLFTSFRPVINAMKTSGVNTILLCLITMCLLVMLPRTSEAAFPTQVLLDELRSEIAKPAKCLPECASIESMSIQLTTHSLAIRLRIHAQENVSIPLPVPLKQWVPGSVRSDEQALLASRVKDVLVGKEKNVSLFRKNDETLWLYIHKGSHYITLEGPVDTLNQLQIGFPLKPHHIHLDIEGWTSEGMDQAVHKITALSFLRKKEKSAVVTQVLEQNEIPVYAQVSRTLNLGLDWEVTTRVQGVSGTAYPVILTVPLMPGESVITDNIKVENQNAVITLSQNNQSIHWNSRLANSPQITLKAVESKQMIERWFLNISPIWHAEYRGIPVIYHQRQGHQWRPEWQPWPGEEVVVTITRPKGVKGKTVTIDQSLVKFIPGEQITAATLEFKLRSSLGGQHNLHLPEKAELQTVIINGRNVPVRNTKEGLSLPIVPGMQKIKIQWNEPRGISSLFNTSQVSLGSESVNSTITLKPGINRWILFASGPDMGPAVLFWGVFGVILLISSALGRIKGTPLKTGHWVLLWIGLSASQPWAVVIIVGCILAFKFRFEMDTGKMTALKFNALQISLVILILLSVSALIASIEHGLLGTPDMQITGNGSTAHQLYWFSDRISEVAPAASLISVPVTVYRLLMLVWSIWLAFALINWAQWGWRAFNHQDLWRHRPKKNKLQKKAGSSRSNNKNEQNGLTLNEDEIHVK